MFISNDLVCIKLGQTDLTLMLFGDLRIGMTRT